MTRNKRFELMRGPIRQVLQKHLNRLAYAIGTDRKPAYTEVIALEGEGIEVELRLEVRFPDGYDA